MKNLTRQNPRQLIVAQELINKVIKLNYSVAELRFNYAAVIIYILIRVKNPVVFYMLRGGIKRCVSAMHLL